MTDHETRHSGVNANTHYGGSLIAESIAAEVDRRLIALAPAVPHDCADAACPGGFLYHVLAGAADGIPLTPQDQHRTRDLLATLHAATVEG